MGLLVLLDRIRFAIAEAWHTWLQYCGEQGWGLLIVFLPFILFDLRRFLGPSVVLLVMRYLGLPRDASAAHDRFLATAPRVSVVLAGYNEEAAVVPAIESLLETGFPNLEIIVVDDGSEDRTYARALPYAQRGAIRLVRNSAATGRGGKPSGMNLGTRMASGDYLVFLDVDTSFDRDLLRHMIGPFCDPKVGVVAGNLKVRNHAASFWTRMQSVEYVIAIGLHRRWLGLFGTNYIASGACGAFRRAALDGFLGCDVATAEDLDNTLKAHRAGWRTVFAPRAIATTDVPETLKSLVHQRIRWDRDLVRVAFRKHLDLLDGRRYGALMAVELGQVLLVSVIANLLYVVYLAVMVVVAPVVLIGVMALCLIAYALLSTLSVATSLTSSERRREERWMLAWAPLLPLYNELIFRWVRIYATAMEILRLNQQDPYLPQSAWRNAPRF
ncbi:MAG: glycosyltransferase family 2 protein [Planctomycetes bacterium]|nr:glycosyltransferase family 2 protein [Planctomycetota bacterium]